MSAAQRLRRLEGRAAEAPRVPEVTLQGWVLRNGEPCDPPEELRRLVEEAAAEPWRAAVWLPDQALIMLLKHERYEFQIIELDDRWSRSRAEWW